MIWRSSRRQCRRNIQRIFNPAREGSKWKMPRWHFTIFICSWNSFTFSLQFLPIKYVLFIPSIIGRRTKKVNGKRQKLHRLSYIVFPCWWDLHFFVSYSRISNYKQCCLYATRYRALVLLPPLFICSSSFFPHPVSDFVFRETSFCYSAWQSMLHWRYAGWYSDAGP